MRLDRYDNRSFCRGRPPWIEALWVILQALFVTSRMPGAVHRKILLKLFGARIGAGVVFRPGLKVKFPWRLEIGEHAWIGEDVWIDNPAPVRIGDHCCISQGAYLCAGSHDWSSTTFDLVTKPIVIRDQTWICARATVGPGVTVEEGAVLALGSVATVDLRAWWIHRGVPAVPVRERRQSDTGGPS